MIIKPTKIYAEVVESAALEQFKEAMQQNFVVQGALMPDAHCGYTLPIGAVVACKYVVVPAYVGYDIGCGMCSVVTGHKKSDIDHHRQQIFDQIYADLPVGTSKHEKAALLSNRETSDIIDTCQIVGESSEDAFRKLGTLGGGNHFCEIGYDEDDEVWITVHSGSRHFGHSIASYYMKLAAFTNVDTAVIAAKFELNNTAFKTNNPDKFEIAKQNFIQKAAVRFIGKKVEGHNGFNVNSLNGQSYIRHMNVALDYALKNRFMILTIINNAINKVIGTDYAFQSNIINRNHNHAEEKDGLWIHRKGATHAEDGMLGVIPGNMRDGVFIVKGKGNPESLCSSSHGAGRVMSRSKAGDTLQMEDFFNAMKGITAMVTNGTLDESPDAYKNIFEVMALQKDLVEVVDYVKPLINIKG